VVIDVTGDMTVTNSASVTIRSLRSADSLVLTSGTFRVTGGASVVQGQLSTTGGTLLTASGATTTFTLTGRVIPGSVNLEAAGGATLSLPGLDDCVKAVRCAGIIWRAGGAGSVLDLPGLSQLT